MDYNFIKNLQLPSGYKPLLKDRTPFKEVSDESIKKYAQLMQVSAVKRGVAAELWRTNNLPHSRLTLPDKFLRYESHINFEELTPAAHNLLVGLGFEPHMFVELFPACYHYNYTLSYDCPINDKFKDWTAYFTNQSKKAMKFFQDSEQLAFVEVERFLSSTIINFDKKSTIDSSITIDLPSMTTVNIPMNPEEERQSSLRVGDSKSVDIHVKFRNFGNTSVTPISDFQQNFIADLKSNGFYEIKSVSNKRTLTSQFIDGYLAKEVFEKLKAYLLNLGIAESLIMEPCM